MPSVISMDVSRVISNKYVSTPMTTNTTSPTFGEDLTPQPKQNDGHKAAGGMMNSGITGGVIGGAAFLFIATIFLLFLQIRKRQSNASTSTSNANRSKDLNGNSPAISFIDVKQNGNLPYPSYLPPCSNLSSRGYPEDTDAMQALNDHLYYPQIPHSPPSPSISSVGDSDYETDGPKVACVPDYEYKTNRQLPNYSKKPTPRPMLLASKGPPADTVSQSQYVSVSNLQYQDRFLRGIPTRRSRSLDALAHKDGEIRRNMKSATMESQDSGFASVFSLPCSPGSPNSIKDFATNSTLSQPPILNAESLSHMLKGAISKYYATPNRQTGVCYASTIFAIGEFDSRGGVLTPANNDSIKLTIPPGALNKLQLVYLLVLFENNSPGDESENISPTIECGPDGLHFQVPVKLSFPHAAVNMDLAALTCEGGSTTWHEDSSRDGPVLLNTTTEIVTMRILHFTKFKVSSRIPVRTQSKPVLRSASLPGKRLSLVVYRSGEKGRIYYISNTSSSEALQKNIDERESRLGFQRNSPWKDFIFYTEQGGLVIEALREVHGQELSYKKFSFSEGDVLRTNNASVEVIATENLVILDIVVYQPKEPKSRTQFGLKLENCPTQMFPSVTEDVRRLYEYQQFHSLMLNLEIESESPNSCLPQAPVPQPRYNVYSRSVSEAVRINTLPPGRFPVEHCEHRGGACSCWKEGARSPVESECGEMPNLRRGVINRRSKESGYESCTLQSPLVSPLKGPNSIADMEGNAPSSDLELTIHTIHSGRSVLGPVTHQMSDPKFSQH